MYLCFDTETTGLTSHCNVLTVYFTILDEFCKPIRSLDLKIKHSHYHVYTKALEINNINLIEHDKIGVTIEEAKKSINEFLISDKISSENYICLGHNIRFDIEMLKNNKIIDLSKNEYIDTIDILKNLKSKNIINQKQSLSLSKICYFFDLMHSHDLLHTAQYDTELTIRLFQHIKNM